MTDLYTDLAWLARAPDDFNDRARRLRDRRAEHPGAEIRDLAATALSSNQLARLARLINAARLAGDDLAPLEPFRLGILSNATTDFIVPAIVATGPRFGFAIECVVAPYGQFVQAALDPKSPINAARCDAVLVAIDHYGLPLDASLGDEVAAAAAVARALGVIDQISEGLSRHGNPTVIRQTLAPPAETLLGSYDAILPGSLRRQAAAFNQGLIERLAGSSDRLLDVAGLAATVGLARWHDPLIWNVAKQSFAPALIPLYADHVGRLLAATRGRNKKVLVLDLDNTVWGGIIGDDGMEGIKISQGDATGEAHLALQRAALNLRERGVLLAVSSKNQDNIARQVFAEHAEMLLREEHITVFQANWNDKGTNIKAIAEAMSLGLDHFVFVDDNPVERGLVRRYLPEVAVPELPADPALYARTLLAAGYFDAVAFSAEDSQRAAMYSDNARRVALQAAAGSIDDYLASLDMTIVFAPFDSANRARITQLINKSNQFNLTTRRYTEHEVAAAGADPCVFTLQVRLLDRYGDNGMIGVVIARTEGVDWRIETWLMSCRVLGRRVERAMLDELVEQARRRGVARLIGNYIPSERNRMVADHYASLDFAEMVDGVGGGGTSWVLDLARAIAPSGFTGAIRRSGLDAVAP